jgi:hypothetical protein
LAFARDDVDAAARWAQTFDDEERPATTLFIWLENPVITWIRVLIEVGSPEGLERARHGLNRIRDELESIHNTCQLIDVAVLQSLALHRQGRSDEAPEAWHCTGRDDPTRRPRPWLGPSPWPNLLGVSGPSPNPARRWSACWSDWSTEVPITIHTPADSSRS